MSSRDVVRRKLELGAKVLSERSLKALWCSLDRDDSDAVMADEYARARSARGQRGRPLCS